MVDVVLVRLAVVTVGAAVAVAVAVATTGAQITGALLTATPFGLGTTAATPVDAGPVHCAELARSAACKSVATGTAGAPAVCAGAAGTCHWFELASSAAWKSLTVVG